MQKNNPPLYDQTMEDLDYDPLAPVYDTSLEAVYHRASFEPSDLSKRMISSAPYFFGSLGKARPVHDLIIAELGDANGESDSHHEAGARGDSSLHDDPDENGARSQSPLAGTVGTREG